MRIPERLRSYMLERWALLRKALPYLFLVLLGTSLYGKTLFYEFTGLDDVLLIVNNSYINRDLGKIDYVFTHDVFNNKNSSYYYRPLLTLSFMADAAVGNVAPVVYHFSNIAYHLTAVCLLFLLLRRLRHSERFSLLCAALFCVLPVLSQGVAWVPGRNDTLLAIQVLLAMIFFIDHFESRKWIPYALHLFFFATALLTKETALALCPVIVLYLYGKRKEGPVLPAAWRLGAGWLLVLVPWFAARSAILQSSAALPVSLRAEIFVKSLPVIVQYLGKVLFPFNLSVMPRIQETTYVYGIAAVVLLVSLFVFAKKRDGFRLIWGGTWFLVFLLPTFLKVDNFYHEHRLYIPVMGLAIMLGGLRLPRLDTLRKRVLAFTASAAVLLTFWIVGYAHCDVFRDKIVFWRNAVATSGGSAMTHAGLGMSYFYSGRMDEAEQELSAAIRINPKASHVYSKLGIIQWSRGNFAIAGQLFRRGVEMDPGDEDAWGDYAGFCMSQGREREAEDYWKKAIAANPNYRNGYRKLAALYTRQGRAQEAAACAQLMLTRFGSNND